MSQVAAEAPRFIGEQSLQMATIMADKSLWVLVNKPKEETHPDKLSDLVLRLRLELG